MADFAIEITRTVTYKAVVHIEATDENAAYNPAKQMVEQRTVPFEEVEDHTDIGPVYRVHS
jgi:hypothetical protein